MGGGHKYLYHIENNDDNSASSSSTDDTPSAVIEHLIGTTTTEKELALHPKFLYESKSSANDDYVAPPRVVEFYAPWYVIVCILCVVHIICSHISLISHCIHPQQQQQQYI